MAEEVPAQQNPTDPGLSVWECTWRDPVRQPNENPQVGDLLRMTCQGPPDEHLQANIFFLEKENLKHVLKVIEVKKTNPGDIDLVVTSYLPGEHKGLVLKFSDSEIIAQTSPLDLTIQSVLPPGQKVEPYPLYGPFEANYSWWLWFIIVATIIVFSLPAVKYIKKRRQKNKLLGNTELQMREQSLLHDMSKFYRSQKRFIEGSDFQADTCLHEIDKTVREYLVIRYKVPAFDWSRSAIVSDIKSNYKKVFEKINIPLQKLLFELEANKKLDTRGCEQILESFKNFYELSEKAMKENSK